MTIELFEIEDGILKPTKHCYTIKWLKDIMDEFEADKRYLGVYAYIFYMTCPNPKLNPYFNMPEDEKEEEILKDIELHVSTENSKVLAGLDRAAKMYETPTLRAYTGLATMLDNLADYMKNTSVTHGKDGNISALIQAAKSMGAIRESFKAVRKDLEVEQNSTSARGGTDLAYDQQ